MKKFLKIPLSSHSTAAANRNDRRTEIPESLDAAILAAAALKARAIRRRRTAGRLLPAIGISAAAAAAAMIAFVPGMEMSSGTILAANAPTAPAVAAVRNYPGETRNQPPAAHIQQHSASDMLALGDTSVLEQENYNLAVMGEFSMDPDSFLM